jgi:hypothetical protein
MALIEINLNPSARDLKWFGVLALAFFIILGALAYSVGTAAGLAIILWSIGLAFFVVYYAVPPMRLVLYRGWLRLFQPIGWLISHALFGAIYYVVFTLIGFCLRVFRYDPMRRRRDPAAKTYWAEHGAETDSSRYFSQF